MGDEERRLGFILGLPPVGVRQLGRRKVILPRDLVLAYRAWLPPSLVGERRGVRLGEWKAELIATLAPTLTLSPKAQDFLYYATFGGPEELLEEYRLLVEGGRAPSWLVPLGARLGSTVYERFVSVFGRFVPLPFVRGGFLRSFLEAKGDRLPHRQRGLLEALLRFPPLLDGGYELYRELVEKGEVEGPLVGRSTFFRFLKEVRGWSPWGVEHEA